MDRNLRTLLQGVDSFVCRAQREARRSLGRVESVRLVPFRGWVTADKTVVLGRAIIEDVALEERLERCPRLVRVAYERFGTLEAEPEEVRVAWQGQTLITESDSGGFIDATFPARGECSGDRTQAELNLVDAGPESAVSAEVFGFHAGASFGTISDIDDTVLETELTNPWKRALQLIYSEQRMRLPFDGIAALYQAFTQNNNPIFYVSNAPWNLYPHVVELLDQQGIPKGPLLLRDSRIGERIVPDPTGGQLLVHKQRALRRLVEDFPGLPLVLLGDSSRRDPLRYVEIAEAYPKRVAAIYIRRVRGPLARRGSLEVLAERARQAGVELLIADDTVTIAKHAQSRGFVPRTEVHRVREGKAQDEQAPPTELTSVSTAAEKGLS
jgi:phosphatidate phosphatase APP1